MPYTPDGFSRALLRTTAVVEQQQTKALVARVKVHEVGVLAGAASVGGLGRKVTPRWVRNEILPGRSPVAKVHLSGGFAILTEKGSYKSPGGWRLAPKGLSGARRNPSRIYTGRDASRLVASGARSYQRRAIAGSGFGPVAHAPHPPKRPQPFFKGGIAASTPAAGRAYAAVIFGSIASTIR